MVWLCVGVLLWMAVHFISSVARVLRTSLVERVGENPYKGIFALTLVLSIALMIIGWRSTTPEFNYVPPTWGAPLTSILMLIAVSLFGAAHQPTRIKRFIRHPQLTGMAVWSLSHLLANGDSLSLVLIGGLGSMGIDRNAVDQPAGRRLGTAEWPGALGRDPGDIYQRRDFFRSCVPTPVFRGRLANTALTRMLHLFCNR